MDQNIEKKLPDIGYGTFPQKESLNETIPTAINCGYRLIDTSDNYHNEEFVGGGLKNAGTIPDDLIVISKFSQPYRTKELSSCFEESKSKLNGVLNIYLLHWPYPFLWKQQWRAMEELYLSGKCDGIGVCNFEKKKLEKLLKACRVKPIIDQFECHPLFRQKETADYCDSNGIRVMCYSPVARMHEKLTTNKILIGLAKKYNKSIAQIVLRWDIDHGYIPIPGSASKTHMQDNIDVLDFALTDEEIKEIDSLDCGLRIRFDPDKRFGKKERFKFLLHRFGLYRKK